MRRFLLIAANVLSLIALLPLAAMVADPFFNKQFMPEYFDHLLLVCPDRVEALRWHDLAGGREPSRPECGFQIPPARQAWVERAVKQLQTPVPKTGWFLRVKQVGVGDQRIEFELCGGKGCFGTIYEVRDGVVTPLKTRIDEPEGGIVIMFVYALLLIPWWLGGIGIGRLVPHWFPPRGPNVRLLPGTRSSVRE